ncbi:hypothetical protein MSPP1_001268 [Malassezia sp. CBS 17886]|nr:hypothetical protein MSPP1_001268 [Malassezia sp. CBS 17886]
MERRVASASSIPTAGAGALALILLELLICDETTAAQLAEQCQAAIADLSEDSRPASYDGLVDVARFCVEEVPEWTTEQRAALLVSQPPAFKRSDASATTSAHLAELEAQYKNMFPGLGFVAESVERTASDFSEELENVLRRAGHVAHGKGSDAWHAELERGLESLWDVAIDRSSRLGETGRGAGNDDGGAAELDGGADALANVVTEETGTGAVPTNEATPSSHGAPGEVTAAQAPSPGDDMDDAAPFLSLATLSALASASPTLHAFFHKDLVQSFCLEEVQKSSSGAAFAWHAAPVAPRPTLPSATPDAKGGGNTKSSGNGSGAASLASTLFAGASPLDAKTPASYSRDITSGTRGKVVGFLGGLLGEEGKTRMDALADQVALRLQTHSVRGPLPSFAHEPKTPVSPSKRWGSTLFRGATAAAETVGNVAGTAQDSTSERIGGRLVGALRNPASAFARSRAPEKQPETQDAEDAEGAMQDSTTTDARSRFGGNLATEGPEAAVASLRAANEALVQERTTFVIDEVNTSAADDGAEEEEEEAMSDVEERIVPLVAEGSPGTN